MSGKATTAGRRTIKLSPLPKTYPKGAWQSLCAGADLTEQQFIGLAAWAFDRLDGEPLQRLALEMFTRVGQVEIGATGGGKA